MLLSRARKISTTYISFVEEMQGCTKFNWKIDNFSRLKTEVLQSMPFFSYSINWEIKVRPTGKPDGNIDFELCHISPILDHSMVYYYCLVFLDLENSPTVWRENRYAFDSSNRFTLKKDKLCLLNDKLTLECHIWMSGFDLIRRTSTYFGHSCIEPESKVVEENITMSFMWSSLELSRLRQDYFVTGLGANVTILLFFNSNEMQAQITLPLVDIVATCKISLLNAAGKRIDLIEEEFEFDTRQKKWLQSTQLTKAMARFYEDKIMHNDTVTLIFAFTFARKVTSIGIVDKYYTVLALTEPESNRLEENSTATIRQVLFKLYEEGFMSDFNIRVDDRTFPVHKAILGARSSVFEAMFTLDMAEKESGSVIIRDMDADTVERMLMFVYSDLVEEDMQWERVSSLYAAADKYAIGPLKQRCCSILKSQLCVSSVPEALLLAFKYQDQELETAALEHVAKNNIVGTEHWSKFEKDNPQVALDMFHKLFIMNIKR